MFPLKTSPFGLFLIETCEKTQDHFEKKIIYQIAIANKKEVLFPKIKINHIFFHVGDR